MEIESGFRPGGSRARPPSLGPRRSRLFERSVYGPVESRRFGRCIGVNLCPPGRRACSFDCVYCEFGTAPRAGSEPRWPVACEVGSELAEALARAGPLDAITISGHGEPTLHPRFAAVVAAVLVEARRARPDLPVRILTNGTGAVRPEVRRALDVLDERIVKLDAGAGDVNRPLPSRPLGGVLCAMSLLRDVTLQSCFIEGAVSNTGDETVRDWIDLVSEIDPAAVQIYTIDRLPAIRGLRPVAAQRLDEIARRLRRRSSAEVHVYPGAARPAPETAARPSVPAR